MNSYQRLFCYTHPCHRYKVDKNGIFSRFPPTTLLLLLQLLLLLLPLHRLLLQSGLTDFSWILLFSPGFFLPFLDVSSGHFSTMIPLIHQPLLLEAIGCFSWRIFSQTNACCHFVITLLNVHY